ncbi:SH3 domain-containing protein [Paracerasibacillus soli]|uniref:SH3 domain-containing protein n=2 Tax=Paracerasibacillus soli TaxID=480284 RepID=A0ABU5CTT9_9BACI|nr:SH3 domain-containing protein [Virgibacillus soli]MDY0409034.1 SH3 domain-containing protein [Virgibacillus soli]MDY0409788.1 SH3 domain-containing protein [Virgibacillus soli]
MSIIIFIYYFIDFLNSLTQVAQYVEETVIPVVQSYTYHEEEGIFQSEKTSVKWIKDELKKDVSNQITNNFRVVSKNNLVVREGKSKDSRISGTLNAGYVVQIVEKRKNWTYVIYSDYENQQIVEGWVFTRYLEQIK